MNEVLEFIKQNPIQVAILILMLLVYLLYKIWQIKKKGLRPTIIEFIVKAEESFNQGENAEKMNYVIDKIIVLLPIPFRLFITREMIRAIVQSVFDEIKKALDYQSLDKTIKEELKEE